MASLPYPGPSLWALTTKPPSTRSLVAPRKVPRRRAIMDSSGVIDEELWELDQFREKLLPYYHRYAKYVARVTDPASPSHPDQMRENGRRFRLARKQAGLSRAVVAEQMGVDPVQLAAFEGGLVPPDDLPEDFVRRLRKILSDALEACRLSQGHG